LPQVYIRTSGCIKVYKIGSNFAVWMIADRLECINKEVASCLEFPVKLSRSKCVFVSVPCASKTERTLQTSPLECGNEDTAALISDFPVFTGTCPSFSEVEN
jgi:hypothetical protein